MRHLQFHLFMIELKWLGTKEVKALTQAAKNWRNGRINFVNVIYQKLKQLSSQELPPSLGRIYLLV